MTPVGASTVASSESETRRPIPTRLVSARIDVDHFAVRPVGLEPDGKLEVPDETAIGWYDLGAGPGEPGVTVLAAHVSWNGSLGPFAYLGDLRAGDEVTIETAGGSASAYEVVDVRVHLKTDLQDEDTSGEMSATSSWSSSPAAVNSTTASTDSATTSS